MVMLRRFGTRQSPVGVTKADRYEPELQRSYEEMAAHDSIAVIPARTVSPKGQAQSGAHVLLVCRWVLARLRHQRFFSLEELNADIRPLAHRTERAAVPEAPRFLGAPCSSVGSPAMRPCRDTYV